MVRWGFALFALWFAGGVAAGQTAPAGDPLRDFQSAVQSWKQAAKDALLARQKYVVCERYEAEAILEEWTRAVAEGRDQFNRALQIALQVVNDAPEQLSPDMAALLGGAITSNYESGNYDAVALYCDKVLAKIPAPPPTILINRVLAAFALNDFAGCGKLLARCRELNIPFNEQMQAIEQNLADLTAIWEREQTLRTAEAARDDLPRVKLTCDVEGDNEVVLELFEDQAPQTVANFLDLVKKGFYDRLDFHQVITHISAQSGSRTGDNGDEPDFLVKGEADSPEARHSFRGAVAMASVHDQNMHGTQFYIVLSPSTNKAVDATIFGRVTQGMDVVNKLNITHTANSQQQRFEQIKGVPPSKILKAEVVRERDHPYEPQRQRNPAKR